MAHVSAAILCPEESRCSGVPVGDVSEAVRQTTAAMANVSIATTGPGESGRSTMAVEDIRVAAHVRVTMAGPEESGRSTMPVEDVREAAHVSVTITSPEESGRSTIPIKDVRQAAYVSVTITGPEESGCSRLPIEDVREAVRAHADSIQSVDNALVTLKTELIEMREQDLDLLKQLIQIGDNIRKLSRSHDRFGRKRKSNRKATQEFMTSAVDLSVTLRRFKGRSGSLFSGDYSTVPLVRRQSEPQVCTLFPPGDAASWNSSRRCSGSSADWWSEGTIGSSEDGLDDFGTTDDDDDDLNFYDVSTASITEDTSGDPDPDGASPEEDPLTALTLTAQRGRGALQAAFRPKSHSVVASTFRARRTSSVSAAGNKAFSEILTNNVTLWKNRLEAAQGVRQRVSILEEEG